MKKTITINEDFFEHLLNCLANQKYIRCVNADASTSDYSRIQRVNQRVIDKAYHKGMGILIEQNDKITYHDYEKFLKDVNENREKITYRHIKRRVGMKPEKIKKILSKIKSEKTPKITKQKKEISKILKQITNKKI